MEINIDLEMMVSVVIPLFNENESISDLYIEICDSLSSYDNWEIIFVDDGSSDVLCV